MTNEHGWPVENIHLPVGMEGSGEVLNLSAIKVAGRLVRELATCLTRQSSGTALPCSSAHSSTFRLYAWREL